METKCNSETKTVKTCNLDSRTPILHPVVLGAPETSISLDTETASLSNSDSDSDTDCHQNSVLPIGDSGLGQISTINVENSTDVVIGPLTQFHGPVTIYQTVNTNTQNNNGMLENHKAEESDSSSKDESAAKFFKSEKVRSKKCRKAIKWSFVCVSVAVSVTVGLMVYFKISSSDQESKSDEDNTITQTTIRNEETTIAGFVHPMYTRSDWGGVPPSHLVNPLKHPTKYVIISHTAGLFCNTFKSCSELVRNIQSYHMQKLESSDIGYNFLIGNDDGIYIGRNWDIRNIHAENNIGISIMGNFVSRDYMTPKMIKKLKDLLELGVNLNKLASDYKLVCHNQTYETESPGKNVCKVVATFPNYYPEEIRLD